MKKIIMERINLAKQWQGKLENYKIDDDDNDFAKFK